MKRPRVTLTLGAHIGNDGFLEQGPEWARGSLPLPVPPERGEWVREDGHRRVHVPPCDDAMLLIPAMITFSLFFQSLESSYVARTPRWFTIFVAD